MDLKGVCFHGGDVPNCDFPHFIVLISDQNPEGKVLLVPISSIKFNASSKYYYKDIPCKYYDDSCVFEGTEIKDDDGSFVLSKPSFARYEWANEVSASLVLQKQLQGIYKYKCKVSEEVLLRLQQGARKSKELRPYFAKYFEYF